jgi:hypothetical protein
MAFQNLIRGAVALLFLLSPGLIFAQDQDEEFQKLYAEYLEINQKLQQVQQQALMDENVAQQAEGYSSFIDAKLKELDPRAGDLVDQREKTIDDIQAAQEDGNFEKIQELQQVYEQVSQELRPYLQQTMEDPEVQERRNEFEEVLIAKMEEIDPQTVTLFNRMAEIADTLDQIMQQP